MSRTLAASVGVLLAALSASVQAESGGSGLISQVEASRYGLERAWFTQVSLDSSRGRISDFTYFVSATQKHTVYEVRYEGRKQTFSERDTDRFGDVLGKEAAEKEAKAFVEELKLRENTLVILTSDNGGMLNQGGQDAWKAGHRPGPGRRNRQRAGQGSTRSGPACQPRISSRSSTSSVSCRARI